MSKMRSVRARIGARLDTGDPGMAQADSKPLPSVACRRRRRLASAGMPSPILEREQRRQDDRARDIDDVEPT